MAARPQPELDAPRGEAAKGLASLIAARQQLDVRLDEIDRQQRQAHEDAARLSAELADLERAALRGEQVSAKEREAAEKALTKAKIAAGEPWAERRAGVQGAMRDEDRELRTFAADHMDTLLVEVGEDAQEAAQAVNQAAARLMDAYEQRQRVERRVIAICSLVRTPQAGRDRGTRAEAVIREAKRLLRDGGEQAPLPNAGVDF